MPTRPKTHLQRMRADGLLIEARVDAKAAAPDPPRESPSRRGYGRAWQRARQRYLGRHPLCVECHAHGQAEAATTVDHLVPHKGDKALFWDKGNWQALCTSCHSRKTAREDGGFGHDVKEK